MDDDAFKIDFSNALMDANIRSKITYDLNTWEKNIESQLIKFDRNPDLRSPDAVNRRLRFLGEGIGEDERTINEEDTIAASYLTLEKISLIRDSIKVGQYPAALSHALDAWVSFMIANYAMGKKFWEDAQNAAEARTAEMVANSAVGKKFLDNARNTAEAKATAKAIFYKKLIPLDEKYQNDPKKGRSQNWRAREIIKELGLKLTPRAVIDGLKKAREIR